MTEKKVFVQRGRGRKGGGMQLARPVGMKIAVDDSKRCIIVAVRKRLMTVNQRRGISVEPKEMRC